MQLPTNNFSSAYHASSLEVLERSLKDIPFYRAWRALDPGAGRPVDERFQALPVLGKADIRQYFPGGFIPQGADFDTALARGIIEYVATSGTTSEQVTNIWNQQWWDASERASWQLNRVLSDATKSEHREALLGSALSIGDIDDTGDIAYEDRLWKNYLFLNEKSSPLLWQEKHYRRMIEELARFQPDILEANPSYLWHLCRYASQHNVSLHQPRAIIYTYELPFAWQKRWIQRVFDCPCASSYGSTELGYVFMECPYGRLHQNTRFVRVDFQPLAPEHGGHDMGRILVTTFGNPWYQIVRFDPGDIVRLSEAPCACGGREGFVLEAIEGRFAYCTQDYRGRLITPRRLDAAMQGVDGISGYSLVQEAPGEYAIRVCADKPLSQAREEIVTALQRVYGIEAKFFVEFCDAIQPEPSGKFCYSRSKCLPDINHFIRTR